MPLNYPFEFEPFGRAFAEPADAPVAVRLGYALRESAKYRPIDWPECCMLPTVGPVASNGASYFTSGSGIAYDEKPVHTCHLFIQINLRETGN